jgi:superfamily II RNA helicase
MIAEYHGLKLDQFQIEAIEAVNSGLSVIVSAPTGTGKTLVADYLAEKAIREQKRIIYTAPIKALSNQKFKDFSRQFGFENVGVMTGDVVVNPAAPLLIMTTEIFRNQVITGDEQLNVVSHVIFDEIHWLNDEDRGTVWEESIILAPAHIKILGLSATIANAEELKNWIEAIRREPVALIEEHRRIVPLEYYYFSRKAALYRMTPCWIFSTAS